MNIVTAPLVEELDLGQLGQDGGRGLLQNNYQFRRAEHAPHYILRASPKIPSHQLNKIVVYNI